jgi:hypothetical protein
LRRCHYFPFLLIFGLQTQALLPGYLPPYFFIVGLQLLLPLLWQVHVACCVSISVLPLFFLPGLLVPTLLPLA